MNRDAMGYMGKTLRIDLTTRTVKVEDHVDMYKDYMGAIAVKLLYDELPDWVTPFDVMNKIIFSCGALIGTTASGACKFSASTLGPVTGGWASGLTDSYVGMELKHSGYDHLIIEGKSHTPCYLWINDDKVEIRDASFLWGKTTWETLDLVRKDLNDEKLHVLSIGPAGENMVRAACIVQDYTRVMGRCGTGAVMGSKNLKAIVCKGTKPIRVADKERFNKRSSELRKRIRSSQTAATESFRQYGSIGEMRTTKQINSSLPFKNFSDVMWPEELYKKMDMRPIIDKFEIAKQGFPGCALCCSRRLAITEGPYKGLVTEPNQWEVMGGLLCKLVVTEPTFAFEINALCSKLGVDVDLPATTIAMLMDAYEQGLLTKDEIGMEMNWGNEESILKMTKMICYREGMGNILAEGSSRAADILGRNLKQYAYHVKNQDLYEALRCLNGWMLGTMVSTRGGAHTTSSPWFENNKNPITDEEAYRILRIKNYNKSLNPIGTEGKAEMVYWTEVLSRALNSTGVCLYNSVYQDYAFTNVNDLAELLSAATGIEHTVEDLEKLAMRQINLEKAFNLRFTNYAREDDIPQQPRHWEEVKSGPLKGYKLERADYEKMLDEYYELHGWDKNSYPTRKTLEELGLSNVADDLEKIGKLGIE